MSSNSMKGMLIFVLVLGWATVALAQSGQPDDQGVEQRSQARELGDEVHENGLSLPINDDGQGMPAPADREEAGLNVQVNDRALDHIVIVPGTRPFEFSIQSETSIAVAGGNILVGYNSSADQPIDHVDFATGRIFFTHRHFSGFSVSHNGGQTWTSGFVPAVPGSPFTFGDPSVGVDRAGNFYYVHLGTLGDAPNFTGAVIFNKSTDGGVTFSPAQVAAVDDNSDKEWLAVGPDPVNGSRDNLYIAWVSFQPTHSELRFARSTDGGATWTSKTIFVPVAVNGLSLVSQYAPNPVVDQRTGRLFVPFHQNTVSGVSVIRVLVSDDAGETFHFVEFDAPGAPDAFGFPNVTPGTRTDCGLGNGGIRLVIHEGANLGGGRQGLPRFRQASRLVTQPAAAAAGGIMVLALNSSTSTIQGDPSSRSEIRLLVSTDGGGSFNGPFTVAAATDTDPQHIHPAVTLDTSGRNVQVVYYVQQADGRVRVDATSGQIVGSRLVPGPRTAVSSVSFDLIPSNNPLPTPTNPFATTNYDRTVRACYDLGEYLSTTLLGGELFSAWGDDRNPWTSPAGSPAAGTHAQPDVFFQGPN